MRWDARRWLPTAEAKQYAVVSADIRALGACLPIPETWLVDPLEPSMSNHNL